MLHGVMPLIKRLTAASSAAWRLLPSAESACAMNIDNVSVGGDSRSRCSGSSDELAVDTIETAAEAFAEQGRPFPTPQKPADDFSGRVTLRIPRSLHGALAAAADDEGVSLNAHLVNVLTYFSGFAAGRAISTERKAPSVSHEAA
jgi:hypothetical protein